MTDQGDGPLAGGVSVPGYDIERELGRGGFAVVYKSQQPKLRRTVALKILTNVDPADADAKRRFEAECQAIGSLSWHPHVVTVYDAGATDDGLPFLAMEHLPSGSLQAKLGDHGPAPLEEVLRVAVQMCDALGAAHKAGILHRDIKPANVLTSRIGDYKLADFGIARFGDSQRTATGVITGTVAYTAPEVLRGDRASSASDLYALGAMLCAVATGQTPFVRDVDESVVAIMYRVNTEDPPPLTDVGVPEDVALFIHTLMAKDPATRPASALEAAQWAQHLQEARGTTSVPLHTDPDLLPALPPAALAAGAVPGGRARPRRPLRPRPGTPAPPPAPTGTPAGFPSPTPPPPSGYAPAAPASYPGAAAPAAYGTPAPYGSTPAGTPAGYPSPTAPPPSNPSGAYPASQPYYAPAQAAGSGGGKVVAIVAVVAVVVVVLIILLAYVVGGRLSARRRNGRARQGPDRPGSGRGPDLSRAPGRRAGAVHGSRCGGASATPGRPRPSRTSGCSGSRSAASVPSTATSGWVGPAPSPWTSPCRGATTVPAAGVTMVGVAPTHRRRGVLTELMRRQLDDVAAGPEPVAVLTASEALIYGRFGYGVATRGVRFCLEPARSAFRPDGPGAPGRLRQVTVDQARDLLPAAYERIRVRRPGAVARSHAWWETHVFLDRPSRREGGGGLMVLVHEDPAGVVDGFATYRAVEAWWPDRLPGQHAAGGGHGGRRRRGAPRALAHDPRPRPLRGRRDPPRPARRPR